MDVDGFDPYEDEYDWRERLETMGEQFQEKLAEKGIVRRFPKTKEQHVPGTVLRTPDGHLVVWGGGEWKPYVPGDPSSVTEWLEDGVVRAPDELPRTMVECPTCHGQGGVMTFYGNPSNGPEHEMCEDCRGTGEIPRPSSDDLNVIRPFRFKGF